MWLFNWELWGGRILNKVCSEYLQLRKLFCFQLVQCEDTIRRLKAELGSAREDREKNTQDVSIDRYNDVISLPLSNTHTQVVWLMQ